MVAEDDDAQIPPFKPTTHHLRDVSFRFTEFLLRNVEEWSQPHAPWPPPPPPVAFSGSDRFIKGRLPHRTLAISASLASLLAEAAKPPSDVCNPGDARADRDSTLASVEDMSRSGTQCNTCETTHSDNGREHTLSLHANTCSHVFSSHSALKSDVNRMRSQTDDSVQGLSSIGVVDGCALSAQKKSEINSDCMHLVDSYPVSANQTVEAATCSTVSDGNIFHEPDPTVQGPILESGLPTSTQQGGCDFTKEHDKTDMICLRTQISEGCPRLSENSLDTLKGGNVAIEASADVEVEPYHLLESKSPLLPSSGQPHDEQEVAKLYLPASPQIQNLSSDMGGIPDLSASCTTKRLTGDTDGEVEVLLASTANQYNKYASMDDSDSAMELLLPSKGHNDNSVMGGASLLSATLCGTENKLVSDANGSSQLSLLSPRKDDKVNNIACDSDGIEKSDSLNILKNTVVEATVILRQAEQVDDALEEGELPELLENGYPDNVKVSESIAEAEMQEEAEGHPADSMELVVKSVGSATDDEMDQPLSLFISRYRTRSSVKLSSSLLSSKDCNKTRKAGKKRKIEKVLEEVTGPDMAVLSTCKPLESVIERSRKVAKTCADSLREVNCGDLSDAVGKVSIAAKVTTSEAEEAGHKQGDVRATQPEREEVMGTSAVILSEMHSEPGHREESAPGGFTGKEQFAACKAVVAKQKSKRGGSAEHKRKRQQKKHIKAKMVGAGKLKLKSCLDKPKEKKGCHFYARGQCEKGASCLFSHAATPRTKSELCKYHVNYRCLKGDDCPFSHALSTFPCKFFHIGGSCLDAGLCRFSHEPLSEEAKQKLLKRVAEEQHGRAEQHAHAENKAPVCGGLRLGNLEHVVPPSDLELFPLGGKHVHKSPLKGKATAARNISVAGSTGITSIQTDRPLGTAASMRTGGRVNNTPTSSQHRPVAHNSSEMENEQLPFLSSGNFTVAQERKAKVDGFLQSQLDDSSLMHKAKLIAASESSGGCFSSLRLSKASSLGPTSLFKPSNLTPSGKPNARLAELRPASKDCNQLDLTSEGANCPNAAESSSFDTKQQKSVADDRSRETDASVSTPAAALGPSLLDIVLMSQKAAVPRGSPASSPGSLSKAIKVTPKQSAANMILDRFLK